MTKGSKIPNKGINLYLRKLLNKHSRTVNDVSLVLHRSRDNTYKLLYNPFLMTLAQLSTLSGYLSTPLPELINGVCFNVPKQEDSNDISTLAELVKKVENLEK